ncbi:MAG: hypothetical protein SNH80_03830 [Rikenellaceae bacterium]
MCIRYIPLESRGGPSVIKLAVSLLSPFIILIYSPKFNRATLWLSLYFIAVLFSALFNSEQFRYSTILYLLSFLLYFQAYYNLIYNEKALSLDYFIKVLQGLILAFTVVLLLQQASIVMGVKVLPIINLTQILDRGIGANSLGGEPSTSARILTVAFLCLMRMYELKLDISALTPRMIFRENRWVTIGFLWSMVTMGSGTAFVGLILLSLYFFKRQHLAVIAPLFVALYFIAPHIEHTQFQRAYSIMGAMTTLDADAVRDADGSGATRIVPLLNTIHNTDLTEAKTWFGEGESHDHWLKDIHTGKTKLGTMSTYGLLSYIISLGFVFSCVIRLFSLETILFFAGMAGATGNIAYHWGLIMLLATSKYFMDNYLETKENKSCNRK